MKAASLIDDPAFWEQMGMMDAPDDPAGPVARARRRERVEPVQWLFDEPERALGAATAPIRPPRTVRIRFPSLGLLARTIAAAAVLVILMAVGAAGAALLFPERVLELESRWLSPKAEAPLAPKNVGTSVPGASLPESH